jgi:D-sedoheptulose 7-phosphate isomerase
MSSVLNLLQEHQAVMAQIEPLLPLVETAAARVLQTLAAGGKIFFMGNGGSASDSQHLAAELVGRYRTDRRALAAIALTTDASILTSVSNDYDFSHIFSRQLEALCQPNDVVVGISTSGNSPNVVRGLATARKLGAFTIGMTGQTGGQLVSLSDLCFCIPSNTVARIQEAHIFIGHTICELVDNAVLAEQEVCTPQVEMLRA